MRFNLNDLEDHQAEALKRMEKPTIAVGVSTCGMGAGAGPVLERLKQEVKDRKVAIDVAKTGCAGMCSLEPLVEVRIPGRPAVMYGNVTPEVARRIVEEHVLQGIPVNEFRVPSIDELSISYASGQPPTPVGQPGPRQYRIVLRNCGLIDPESLDEYIAMEGYQALQKVLSGMTPEQIIEELKISGLRGRGGAGFPVWMKWQLTREAKGEEHYIICNGDEGDPGAYMDRSVLEGDPHSVLEGMIIAGYVIGARQGVLYIRAEYPLAVQRIEQAIRQAHSAGLLGANIFGTDFSFDLEVRLGAGAFVCGEETALIASVEGKRGTPRPRPPFPSVKGLWGMPTMINNVETLANISPILIRGGRWFSQVGIGKSTGTKVFAVTGKIRNSGLVEIPMGTPLRDIIDKVCGGVEAGRKVKAVQTGGPSGGLIPEKHLDTPVSYEHLQQLGSIMGSGGMIVMDDADSVVELSRFYLGFCVDESCGKCAPCRIGGVQLLRTLNRIAELRGTEKDLATVRRIASAMQKASLCGLGQTAPNPVLSALRYFESEFLERIAAAKIARKEVVFGK